MPTPAQKAALAGAMPKLTLPKSAEFVTFGYEGLTSQIADQLIAQDKPLTSHLRAFWSQVHGSRLDWSTDLEGDDCRPVVGGVVWADREGDLRR